MHPRALRDLREWGLFVLFVGPNLFMLAVFAYWRELIPNGDEIIGKGLERITTNSEPAELVFKDIADQLNSEKQPVLRALKELGEA